MAVLTSEDEVLKELRYCIPQNGEQRCKDVDRNMHLYWRDLHIRSGCVYVGKRVAITKSIQEAVLESVHLRHPGRWGMITPGQYAFWSNMHREFFGSNI